MQHLQDTFNQVIDIYHDITQQQRPSVKRYLDGITQTWVYESLGKLLSSHGNGGLDLQATFDKQYISGPLRQKYWNEECFQQHVRRTFSPTAISDPEIQLLWRSFSYYAHHPFPYQKKEVDFDAFKRAVSLLVFQSDEKIGTNKLCSNDWIWTPWRNDSSLHAARFLRLFRSIGKPTSIPDSMRKPPKLEFSEESFEAMMSDAVEKGSHMDPVVSDTMDILAAIGPEFIHSGPMPRQTEAVARRLLVACTLETDVKREDVLILVGLLARIKLKKEKWGSWGSYYQYGDIVEASLTGEKDLETEMLVYKLCGDERQDSIAMERLIKASDFIPDLHSRVYQLWAILFQPLLTDEEISRQALKALKVKAESIDASIQEQQWPPKPKALKTEDDGPVVLGEELKKRIQGFGSR